MPPDLIPLESHPSFMFAMGELTGQVKALADSVSGFTDVVASQERRIAALEQAGAVSHWLETAAVAIATFIATSGVEWVIYHGVSL